MSRFLALDPDAHGLYVVAGALTAGGVEVERAVGLPLAGDDARPLSLANAGDLGARLKELLKSADVKPAPVLLVLGRDRVIFKDVKYPPCAPTDEPAIVRAQALRDMVEAVGDVVLDYVPTGETTDGLRSAQVVFVRKDVVLAARQLCEAAGLRLAGITPRPFALAAAMARLHPVGAVALATVWEGGGEFVVSRGREVLFARTLSPAASGSEAAFTGELRRNLTVYAGQRGAAAIGALAIGESSRSGAARRIADALSLPVESFDPLAGSPAGDAVPDSLRGRFVAPAGVLELRRVSPTMPINFTLPRQPRAEPTKNRLLLAVAGLAALLVFGTLGFLGYLTLQDADATVASLRADQELVDADISRYDIDVKKLAAVDEFEARQVVWLDELYEIADRIPDVEKVKVTLIDGKPVIVPKAPVRPGAVAANPKTLKPVPAASLKLVMRSTDGPMVQRIADAFKADKFYVGTTKADSAAGATGGRGQQYEFNTQILHRGPGDYLRRLGVSFPKRARDPDAPDDEQGGDS